MPSPIFLLYIRSIGGVATAFNLQFDILPKQRKAHFSTHKRVLKWAFLIGPFQAARLSKRYLYVGYMVAEGMNRASLQMCRCPSLMELMVNTSRADGPLLAIHCRGGGSLQLRKTAGKPYSIRRATYRKQCETV